MRPRPSKLPIAAVAATIALALITGATAHADTGRMVALGDSNPAASGLLPADPAAPYNCFRTVNGYPRIAAQALGAAAYGDATCAAAKIENFWQTQIVFGQPTNPPQLNALDGSERIVVVTVGDNDAGVTGVTDDCLSAADPRATPCHDHYGDSGLDARARSIADPLSNALAAVRQRAPAATIFMVGYPRMLPDDVSSCWGKINVSIPDAPLVTGWERTINETQKSVAASRGVVFVDLFGAWSPGRDGCSDPATAWVKPQINPPGGWALHPTLLGQQATAARLVDAIRAAGLWVPPTAPSPAESTTGGAPHAHLRFSRLRPVHGARHLATLRRPHRGGGRIRVEAKPGSRLHLQLERKHAGRRVDGQCRKGTRPRSAPTCRVFRSWGKATSVNLRHGLSSVWLTGSTDRRRAAGGLYRLRYWSTADGKRAVTRQFRIAAR